ncbi:hypothetical protein PHAVU_006G147200 [Phaseolus vulgaris]|uniref:Stigma-specific STIG1-like protein 1 n=1 Tax=Phaseolus vulgaris TaxID=3885 RepID=V7BP07_PHAVU|nr:hypothetical protein PHAVU_006G147200g [Phaseolus vulgaris]ESW19692.1 hypothetical protein PHAVU_006G147200g [Phaseolus vulgaris]
MKLLKTLFLVALLMALAITALSATSADSNEEPKSLRGTSRFLSQRVALTCEKNPKICLAKGSAGPDCCNKKCVKFSTDRLNCGRCGKKCSFGKICCEGKCVNPNTNEKHCGKCGIKCNAKGSCVFGMCSYG